MQNNFSLTRFWNLAKLNFAIDRKMLVTVLLCFVGVVTLPYIQSLLSPSYIYGKTIYSEYYALSSMPVLFVLWILGTSRAMRPYFSHSQSSASLMLPATNGEKFLEIFLRTLVGNLVILMAVVVIINLLWSVVLGAGLKFPPLEWATNIAMICFFHAFFLLGATIFRRNAWIYTLLCGFAIMLLLIIIFGSILIAYNSPMHDINIQLTDISQQLISFIFTTVLTLTMWWIAWYRFTKIQITK